MTHKSHRPAVLALNGPASSGKGWIVENVLRKLIPDALVVSPSRVMFGFMQQDGLVPEHITSYDQYKAEMPHARSHIIDYGAKRRAADPQYAARYITESVAYNEARVVIVDNFGFEPELRHFHTRSYPLLLLRIDAPFDCPEPYKSHTRRRYSEWRDDSRRPLFFHYMLTTYDSLQMVNLLKWLLSPELTREEAGPYYEIRELWHSFFAPAESTGDLFARRSAG